MRDKISNSKWSVRVAERLVLPTSDHGVSGSNPAGGEILPKPKRRFIAQSLSCSRFHRLEMTEILLKGRKTLTHPSIKFQVVWQSFKKMFQDTAKAQDLGHFKLSNVKRKPIFGVCDQVRLKLASSAKETS